MGIPETLERLAAFLDGYQVRWYLFGAQAAIIHGGARLSADIDVTVEIGPEAFGAFLTALTGAGFEPRVGDPAAFARTTRVLPLVDRQSGVPVDVVLAGPGPEEQFLARAQRLAVGAAMIPVISPEDLVVTKILAGRPKDLEDVKAVLQHQGAKLGLDQARSLLEEIETALDRNDLVVTLDYLSGKNRT